MRVKDFYQVYFQDILSFKKKYSKDHIEEIKKVFEPIPLEKKAEILKTIRQKHLSRLFTLAALAATKPTPEEFEKLAPNAIMHLGDVINFIEIYYKIHDKEPDPYIPQLKKLIQEMPRTKIELYSYHFTPTHVEEYLTKHLGVTLAKQIRVKDDDPDNTAYRMMKTYQYRPLLAYTLTHLNDIKYESTLEALSIFFGDPTIIENLDIPPMTLALHFSAVAKKAGKGEFDRRKAAPVLGGLAWGFNHLLKRIINDPEKKDWNVVIFNTPEGKDYLNLPIGFRFYRDEIVAVTAAIAAGNTGRITFVSDGVYDAWVERNSDYVKVFRRTIGLLLKTRSELSFRGKLSLDEDKDTLVILFDKKYLDRAVKMFENKAVYYVISEESFFKENVLSGFSERLPLLFAFPIV